MRQCFDRTAIKWEMIDRLCRGCEYSTINIIDYSFPNPYDYECQLCHRLDKINDMLDSLPEDTTYVNYWGFCMPDTLKDHLQKTEKTSPINP